MKKLLALVLAAVMTLSLAACGTGPSAADPTPPASTGSVETSQSEPNMPKVPESVTVQTLNGNQEIVDLEVPYSPQRIAILDLASLDILDALGVGDRVVGSASTSLDYLQKYVTDENIAKLGTIKEADLEAVMACQPDVIFIGGRMSISYDPLT